MPATITGNGNSESVISLHVLLIVPHKGSLMISLSIMNIFLFAFCYLHDLRIAAGTFLNHANRSRQSSSGLKLDRLEIKLDRLEKIGQTRNPPTPSAVEHVRSAEPSPIPEGSCLQALDLDILGPRALPLRQFRLVATTSD